MLNITIANANRHETGAYSAGPYGKMNGIEQLLKNAFIPLYTRSGVENIMDTLSRLIGKIPFYTISFLIGADALGLAKEV